MPKIGAHVSAAVSLDLAFERAENIGAECFQMFISPPQQWVQTIHGEEEIEKFKAAQEKTGIWPNFIHATYLVNLGTSKEEHLQKSIDWLIYGLNMASKLGVQGVIVHTGSHKGSGFEGILEQVAESIRVILGSIATPESKKGSGRDGLARKTVGPPYLILETSAGGGGSIGRTFQELGQILTQVQDDRLKVCIDLQHIFASGYDIRTPLALNEVLQEFDEQVGLSNLVVIHANDSKTELGSNRDRHENIGEGLIGEKGFKGLINHPKLKEVPFILEVPGFAGKGPDIENVQALKSLRKSA